MDLLRQTPFNFSLSYKGLTNSTSYLLEIYSSTSETLFSVAVTSSASGVVSYTLPASFQKYDGTYSLYIYTVDADGKADETVIIDTLYIYRPYVNPITLAEGTSCDAAEYTELEKTARFIINTLVGGFYYELGPVQMSGLGTDYLSLPKRATKINYVYENNVKVYDRLTPITGQYTYSVSPDRTALTIAVSGQYNKASSKPVSLPVAASDSFMLYGDNYDQVLALTELRGASFFSKGFNYIVYGEWGYPVVPEEIKEATRLLIDDIKCGRLDYVKRYVKEYETDQFKVKYGEFASRGSGNLIVDKIIEKYSIPISNMGVL